MRRQSAEGEWLCDDRGRGEREEKGAVYIAGGEGGVRMGRWWGGGGGEQRFSAESYLIGE